MSFQENELRIADSNSWRVMLQYLTPKELANCLSVSWYTRRITTRYLLEPKNVEIARQVFSPNALANLLMYGGLCRPNLKWKIENIVNWKIEHIISVAKSEFKKTKQTEGDEIDDEDIEIDEKAAADISENIKQNVAARVQLCVRRKVTEEMGKQQYEPSCVRILSPTVGVTINLFRNDFSIESFITWYVVSMLFQGEIFYSMVRQHGKFEARVKEIMGPAYIKPEKPDNGSGCY